MSLCIVINIHDTFCTWMSTKGTITKRTEPHQRRRLGEVVGCIVGNGNSRYTKSTVQLANFPGRRRRNVSSSSNIFKRSLNCTVTEKENESNNFISSVRIMSRVCRQFSQRRTKKIYHHKWWWCSTRLDIILSYFSIYNVIMKWGDY